MELKLGSYAARDATNLLQVDNFVSNLFISNFCVFGSVSIALTY